MHWVGKIFLYSAIFLYSVFLYGISTVVSQLYISLQVHVPVISEELEKSSLELLGFFCMMFDQFLTIVYVSENSHQFFQSPSTCLIGQPMSSIVYSDDLIELSDTLTNVISNSVKEPKKFSCFCRLRFPFKRASGILNITPGYRLYTIHGLVNDKNGLIQSLCTPVFVDELIIRPIDNHTFVTLLDLDSMTILYQDQRAVRHLGYELNEVKGQSALRFLHPSFVNTATLNPSVFFEKGETMTEAYLSKTKTGWAWLRSNVALYDSSHIEYKSSDVIFIAITNVLGEEHEYTNSEYTSVENYYESNNELISVDRQLGVSNMNGLEPPDQLVTQVFQAPLAVLIHGIIQKKEYSESMSIRYLQHASHCENLLADSVVPPQMSSPITPQLTPIQCPVLPNADITSSQSNLITTYESCQHQQQTLTHQENGFPPPSQSPYFHFDTVHSPTEYHASSTHPKPIYKQNSVLPSDLLTTPIPIFNHLQDSTFAPNTISSYDTTNPLFLITYMDQHETTCPTYDQYHNNVNYMESFSVPLNHITKWNEIN